MDLTDYTKLTTKTYIRRQKNIYSVDGKISSYR